jgi:predicted methyltransferase
MQRVTSLSLGSLVLASLLAVPGLGRADSHELAERLSKGDRAEADRARDAGRKPAEVIAFLGIAPGMTVIDLIAAGGYYTEVLSVAVGPEGKVYAQNNDFVLKMREGANEKALSARLAGGRLANVERVNREVAELGLAAGSVDGAITALNFHDVYNSNGEEAAQGFLKAVYAVLKPGGVLGVIDHVGDADADNKELHRIEESRAVAAAKAAGFQVEARGDLLRNPGDDHSKNVFDPSIRGKTDRFALLLRKPR